MLKTRHSDASAAAGDAAGPTLFSDIDKLAKEIFARFHDENCDDAVEDPQGYLERLAGSLLHSSSVEPELIHAALDGLPQCQHEALLLHLDGLTCVQIAHRQGKTYEAALKELTSAYTRVRFQLEPIEGADSQTLPDSS